MMRDSMQDFLSEGGKLTRNLVRTARFAIIVAALNKHLGLLEALALAMAFGQLTIALSARRWNTWLGDTRRDPSTS